jgi:hypothetical protein
MNISFFKKVNHGVVLPIMSSRVEVLPDSNRDHGDLTCHKVATRANDEFLEVEWTYK